MSEVANSNKLTTDHSHKSGDNKYEEGIVLCLSGGGFRATIYHLGVIDYLRRNGEINKVKHIVSVSGGSILAAILMLKWNEVLDTNTENNYIEVVKTVFKVVRTNIRNKVLSRAFPWIGRKKSTFNSFVEILDKTFSSLRDNQTCLARNLNNNIEFHFLTTDANTGSIAAFVPSNSGTYRIKMRNLKELNHIKDSETDCNDELTLANVVAYSAAFPLLISPGIDNGDVFGLTAVDKISHLDGGLIDNTGIEYACFSTRIKNFQTLIVSDAGIPFEWDSISNHNGTIGVISRSIDLMMKKTSALLLESINKVKDDKKYLELKHIPLNNNFNRFNYEYSSELVSSFSSSECKVLSTIRTDLDSFEDNEISAIYKLGYENAIWNLRQNRPVQSLNLLPTWLPCFKSYDLIESKKEPFNIDSIKKNSRSHLSSIPWTRIAFNLLPTWIKYLMLPCIMLLVPCGIYGLFKPNEIKYVCQTSYVTTAQPIAKPGNNFTLDLGDNIGIEFIWCLGSLAFDQKFLLRKAQLNNYTETKGIFKSRNGPIYSLQDYYPKIKPINGFWISKHELTREQYSIIADAEPVNDITIKNLPAEIDYSNFSAILNNNNNRIQKVSLPEGYKVRIPHLHEWHYACTYKSDNIMPELKKVDVPVINILPANFFYREAVYNTSTDKEAKRVDIPLQPVGSKNPNNLAIYDMYGNVEEYCTIPGNDNVIYTVGGCSNSFSEELIPYFAEEHDLDKNIAIPRRGIRLVIAKDVDLPKK